MEERKKVNKAGLAEDSPTSDAELEQVTGGIFAFHANAAFPTASPAASKLLLFDEADGLFAKRTTVKDAHDRYGNP